MKTDMAGAHRLVSAVGVLLLFEPSHWWRHVFSGSAGEVFFERLWPATASLGWTFFALAIAGFGFCWWARLHLGKLWSGFVTLKEDHRIIDTGPYALVRHPIYTGLMFAATATASMRATPAAFLGAALITVGFTITARIEESFLRSQLGAEGYNAYSRRVGMLVPGVGRYRTSKMS